MLSEFQNLPGIYTFKDDGNLRVLETVPGEVTLIVGTSPDGPIGQIYLVTDTGAAERTFDPDLTKEGTLLKKMYEVAEGGAKYIALFRIGASPVALDFVNGHTIIVDDASADAGSKYKLYYTNDNSGEEVIRVYDASTGTILFDSFSGINNGKFSVFGTQVFDANDAITIGSPSAPVTFSALKDFTNSDFAIGGDNLTVINNTKTATTTANIFKAGQIVKIDATENDNDGYFVVEYVTLTSGTYTVKFSKKVNISNGEVVDVTWSGFTVSADGSATGMIMAKYIEANDGLSLSLNQTFQALAKAYWELETAQVDMVIPAGVYFDAKNVVDNEGRFAANQSGYVQPTGSFLGKGYEFINNGNIYFAFKNSFTHNTSDLTADELPTPYELGIDGFAAKAWLEGSHSFETAIACASDADIAAAADDIAYNELNFGYQLASFCDGLSTNESESWGTISMTPPVNTSKAAIYNWLGKAPVFDANGTMVTSGTGVLGYKFKTGSLGVLQGLFRTSNGYPNGSAVLDRNGQKIDIGKYLDVTANPLTIRTSHDGTSVGYIGGGNGAYAGLLMSLKPNQAATNKRLILNTRLPFILPKMYLDQLTAAGYVTFAYTTDRSVKVVDAPTAALPTSDYNRRSVCRVASATIDIVRKIAEPYIGAMTNDAILQNLEDEINNRLKDLASSQYQWLKGGAATLKQTAAMAIRGEAALQLILVTSNELRRLTIYLSLSK